MARKPVSADSTHLPRGALIEFIVQGSYVKVSAVDPITFVEVSIVGDPAAGEQFLARQAVRKLERMVYKYKHSRESNRRRSDAAVPRNRRPEPPSGWDL